MKTPEPARTKTRGLVHYPLHVQIGTLMILLVTVTGTVIALFSYRQTSAVILQATSQHLAQVHDEVAQSLRRQGHATRTAVARLAKSPLAEATGLEERLPWVPAMVQALQDNPHLDALYVGYGDGDFFLARPLLAEALRRQVDAPTGAAYQINAIDLDGDARTTTHLFYDVELRLVERRRAPDTAFDPRQRPWYLTAIAEHGTLAYTAPYVYFTTGEVGVTAARAGAAPGSVVAADRTLGDLSRSLASHAVSPSAELALYAENGQALAYRDPARLVRTDPATGKPALARIDELGSPVLARLAASWPRAQEGARLEQDGRLWLGEQRVLDLTPGVNLYLAMLAPEDELLAEAHRQRRVSVLLTLATILAALPLAWLASRMVANPLRRLAGDARAIREFDFSRPVETRSVVLEIDQLASAMSSMKQTIRGFLDIWRTSPRSSASNASSSGSSASRRRRCRPREERSTSCERTVRPSTPRASGSATRTPAPACSHRCRSARLPPTACSPPLQAPARRARWRWVTARPWRRSSGRRLLPRDSATRHAMPRPCPC
jgi:hypothetical protein